MRQTINLTEAGLDSTVRLAEVKLDGSDTGSECGPEYGPECIKGNVIICPGGAYRWHSPREALPVAKAFAAQGWKPWILYYKVSVHGEVLGTAPLCQAAAAVRKVRAASPGRPVILCGFSAGGHVAASLGVHWNDEHLFAGEDCSVIRPDGLILGYPVITAGKYAHRESMEMLAGPDPAAVDPAAAEGDSAGPDSVAAEGNSAGSYSAAAEGDSAGPGYYSLEKYVDAQTPPAFIWHTAGDSTVAVQNSLCFAESLAAKGVPFELHIYPYGEHGLSLATREVEEAEKQRYADPHVAGWFDQCAQWLDLVFLHPHASA